MIDIKVLRDNPDLVRVSQRGRGESVDLVDQVLAADDARRMAEPGYRASTRAGPADHRLAPPCLADSAEWIVVHVHGAGARSGDYALGTQYRRHGIC